MSDIPFRFKNRTSQVTGFIPDSTGICDGEFFIQQADKAILFKDVDGNLVQVKNIQTGSFITTGQTGSFGGGNVDLSSYVTTGQTGVFALTSNTGNFITNRQTGVSGSAIIGGTGSNFLCTGAINSVILGGNFVTGTVCNTVYAQNFCAVGGFFKGIGSGLSNVVTLDPSSNIPAYSNNSVATASVASAVLAANSSSLSAYYSAIIGGNINSICGGALTSASVVLGGMFNRICSAANCSAVLGGAYNCVENIYSANVGGFCNGNKSCQSSIIAGTLNCLCSGAVSSVILGGSFITGTTCNTAFANNIVATSTIASCSNFITPLICTDGIFPNTNGGSCGSLIISSRASTIGSLQCGIILNASSSCLCGSSHGSMILGGISNCVSISKWNSAIIQGCGNTMSSSCSIILAGSGITASVPFTAYASNFCAAGGKYFGDGSALTGLATGAFITTGQTGAFGGSSINTGSFVTTGQTGTLVGTNQTGNFLTLSNFQNFSSLETDPPSLATSNHFTILNGCSGSIYLACYVTILNGKWNAIQSSECASILNGCANGITNSTGVLVGNGRSNTIYNSYNSSILNGSGSCIGTAASGACYSTIINGCCSKIGMLVGNSMIVGSFNCICDSKNSVYIFGSNITGSADNTTYVNNICSNAKYYGDGSALTGLLTGSFITTSQTGVFALAANTGSFVTTAQTGGFATSGHTHTNFVTTGQTGVFALVANTGSFVTTAQTGIFITTGQTGSFGGSVNTGSFVTTGQTGIFLSNSGNKTLNAGSFTAASGFVACNGRYYNDQYYGYVIVGDGTNSIPSSSPGNSIFGGTSNTISSTQINSTIVGGRFNNISSAGSNHSVILAGCYNTISNSAIASVVAGGGDNNICCALGFIGGGCCNHLRACNSAILGSCKVIATESFTTYVTNLCSVSGYVSVGAIEENIITCASGASGLINFDTSGSASMYYIGNSTANFYLNLRSNSGTTINSILETNKTLTVTFLNTNGSTAYPLTGVAIDGSGRSIKWLNGTGFYPAGNVSSIDTYSITAIKTGDNLYTVLASQGKFV